MPVLLGLLFGVAMIVIGVATGVQWITSTVLLLCLIGWLVLEIRERGTEGWLTVAGVLAGIALIALALIADVDWLTAAVLVLILVGWLLVMIRDRDAA